MCEKGSTQGNSSPGQDGGGATLSGSSSLLVQENLEACPLPSPAVKQGLKHRETVQLQEKITAHQCGAFVCRLIQERVPIWRSVTT